MTAMISCSPVSLSFLFPGDTACSTHWLGGWMDVSKKTEISYIFQESNCELLKNWVPSKRENSPKILMLQTGKHGLKLNSYFCLVKGMQRWNFASRYVKVGERTAVSRNWNFIGFLSRHNYFSLLTWMSRILVCKWIIIDSPSLNIAQSQGLVAAYGTAECQKLNVCLF